MQAVQEDRDDNSMDNVTLRLGEFLTTVLQDALTLPRLRRGTEQATSSTAEDAKPDQPRQLLCFCVRLHSSVGEAKWEQ